MSFSLGKKSIALKAWHRQVSRCQKEESDRPDSKQTWFLREKGGQLVSCVFSGSVLSRQKWCMWETPRRVESNSFWSLGGYHSIRALHKAGKASFSRGNISVTYLDASDAPHPTHPLLPTVPLTSASWVSCRSFSFISLRTESSLEPEVSSLWWRDIVKGKMTWWYTHVFEICFKNFRY